MKIGITADLHCDHVTVHHLRLVELAKTKALDAIVLCGDTGSHAEAIAQALELFKDLSCAKYLVAGNHEFYQYNPFTCTGDSWKFYTEGLPKLCQDQGFWFLDEAPKIIDKFAFVGNVGWYDGSFRDKSYDAYPDMQRRYLLQRSPWGLQWNDVCYVKCKYTIKSIAQRVYKKLEEHIKTVYDHVDEIYAFFHHIPFKELVVVKPWEPNWQFGNYFQGQERVGKLVLKYPKITYSFSGHVHEGGKWVVKGQHASYNLRSTYEDKELFIIDTQTREWESFLV